MSARAYYEDLKRRIEEDYRRKLEALEVVIALSEEYDQEDAGEAEAEEEEPGEEEHVGRWIEIPVEKPEPQAERQVTMYEGPNGEVVTGVPDFPGDPSPAEPECTSGKRCRTCGEAKDRSEFGKNSAMKDGLNGECRDCKRTRSRQSYKRQKRAKGNGQAKVQEEKPKAHPEPPVESAGAPEVRAEAASEPEQRLCANGERCAAYEPPFGEAAILDVANTGPLCRRCQRRAGLVA